MEKKSSVHDTDLYTGYYLPYKSNAYTTKYAFNELECPAYEKKRLTSKNTGNGKQSQGQGR